MIIFQSREIGQLTESISMQNKLFYFKVACNSLLTLPLPHGLNQTAGFTDFHFSLWLAESNWQAADS